MGNEKVMRENMDDGKYQEYLRKQIQDKNTIIGFLVFCFIFFLLSTFSDIRILVSSDDGHLLIREKTFWIIEKDYNIYNYNGRWGYYKEERFIEVFNERQNIRM
tara:strand:- start:181 stop:492 length:312 start_codon:yes stop_codon:yes gene_type:complete